MLCDWLHRRRFRLRLGERRRQRRAWDRHVRRHVTHRVNYLYVVHECGWWRVFQQGRRGLLVPVTNEYANMKAALTRAMQLMEANGK